MQFRQSPLRLTCRIALFIFPLSELPAAQSFPFLSQLFLLFFCALCSILFTFQYRKVVSSLTSNFFLPSSLTAFDVTLPWLNQLPLFAHRHSVQDCKELFTSRDRPVAFFCRLERLSHVLSASALFLFDFSAFSLQ